MLLEISQNLQENTCARVSFLIKLQALGQNLFFNKVAGHVFSCKFCEISKNSFFYRTPLDDCFCICSTEWRIQYYDPEKCFCKFYSRKTRKYLPLTLLSGFSSSTKSKKFIPPKFLTVKFRSSHRRCSVEKDVQEISQNSEENACQRVPFIIKLQTWDLRLATLLKKRLLHRRFTVLSRL